MSRTKVTKIDMSCNGMASKSIERIQLEIAEMGYSRTFLTSGELRVLENVGFICKATVKPGRTCGFYRVGL